MARRLTNSLRRTMKIAVEGCCHGELDAIYSHIQQLESRNKYKVDALLICGDFQAIRNHQDLQCMSVPQKYKQLQKFHKYYTGEKVAPILTIVIGGNHEASNYMWELYHGGWLAPNIYFLGHAGSVLLNGIRIAGASGIYKRHDFKLGHYEKLPYDNSSMRSIYHIREYSVRKLSLLPSADIFLSHDWPQSIEHHGDLRGLLQRKSFLRQDIDSGELGSPPLMGLLHTLRPKWWFAAHLHTRYSARVVHGSPAVATPAPATVQNPDEIMITDEDELDGAPPAQDTAAPASASVPSAVERNNPDEITLDEEEENVAPPPPPPPPTSETKFLALDKCLPKRQFLEVVDVPIPAEYAHFRRNRSKSPTSPEKGRGKGKSKSKSRSASPQSRPTPLLEFDPEWLAICRAFHPLLSTTRSQPPYPDEPAARAMVAEARAWVTANVRTDAAGRLPVGDWQAFVPTAPGPATERGDPARQPPWYTNPQTEAFCRMLDIPNKINPPPPGSAPDSAPSQQAPPVEEIGA